MRKPIKFESRLPTETHTARTFRSFLAVNKDEIPSQAGGASQSKFITLRHYAEGICAEHGRIGNELGLLHAVFDAPYDGRRESQKRRKPCILQKI